MSDRDKTSGVASPLATALFILIIDGKKKLTNQ